MVIITREALLPAPAAEVFAVASPPVRWSEWLSLHVRWPEPPPSDAPVGTELTQVVNLLNIPMPMQWRVTEHEQPHRFAMAGKARMGVTLDIRFELEDVDGGSRVVVTAELDGALLVGSLRNVAQKYADAQLEASVNALRGLLV